MYFDLAFELRYNTKANIDQINETLSKNRQVLRTGD